MKRLPELRLSRGYLERSCSRSGWSVSRSRRRKSSTIAESTRLLQPGLSSPERSVLGRGWTYGFIVGNNPINKIDPLGLMDFTLIPGGTWEHNDQQKFYDDPRIFDIGGHGNPNSLFASSAPGSYPYSAQEVYELVKNKREFQEAKSVKIWACNAGFGKNSFAEQFAKISGKRTTGATGYLEYALQNGDRGTFQRFNGNPFNLFRPSTWSSGGWRSFNP